MKLSAMFGVLALVLAAVPSPSRGAILLNFGATVSDDDNSAAHQEGDATGTNWNLITADASSGIVTDGGNSTSVTVDLGKESSTSSQSIDWSATGYNNSALGSQYSTGVYAGNGRSATYTVTGIAIGARISGLAPGTYYVYVNGRNTNASGAEDHYFRFAAVSSASGSTDFSSLSSLYEATTTSVDSTWTDEVDYVMETVEIDENEDLVVIGEGEGGRGFFNTIVIASLSGSPSVDAGEDDEITLPDTALLDGWAYDDGLPDPPGELTVTWTKQSGPGTVTFDDDNILDAEATFSEAGTYVLRLTADDGDTSVYDEVTITVNAAPPAASGATILLNFGATVSNDDNSPAHQEGDATGTNWNLITADASSGIVTDGGNATSITVDLGRESTTSSQSIDWSAASYSNSALGSQYSTGVYAGNGRSATYTSSGIAIGARISGLSPGEYYVYVNGRNTNAPGAEDHYFRFTTVSSASGSTDFSSLSSLYEATTTSVDSTWTEDVDYVVETVEVGESEDLVVIGEGEGGRGFFNTIAVTAINESPTVDAGEDDEVTLPESAQLDGTADDDGVPDPPGAVTVTWTKQSGPGTVTFDDDSALDAEASFSQAGEYVLRLTADDSAATAYDEVTITVNEPPSADEAILLNFGATVSDDTNSPVHQDRGTTGVYWNLVTADLSSGVVTSVNDATSLTVDIGKESGSSTNTIDWSATGYTNSALGSQVNTGVYAGNGRSATYTSSYIAIGARIGGLAPGEYDVYVNGRNTNVSGEEKHDFRFTAVSSASGSTDYSALAKVRQTSPSAEDLDSIWTDAIDYVVQTVEIGENEDLVVIGEATSGGRGWFNTLAIIPSGANIAPTVDAGENVSISLPQEEIDLDATVDDDGLPVPPGEVTVLWTKQSGPGTVTFGDDEAVDTTATFSQVGTYVLRLTAADDALTTYDEVTIAVCPDLPSVSMEAPAVFDYQNLTLVDEVDCGDAYDSHTLYESTQGVSEIQTILSDQCRVIPNIGEEPKYFAYKIGEDCDLEAGSAYVLVVEYPEDMSRSVIVCNNGCETSRGFHTGFTVGDALSPSYVSSNPESISYGLSREYRRWEQLFHLNDRTPDIVKDGTRPNEPEDGFYVVIAQFRESDCPLNSGAAVRRIALYEAPSQQSYTQTLAELPEGLPQRHLFWREEMADGVVHGDDEDWGLIDPIDFYRYKARLHKFLGMNTFSKDLLEFGHCQDWDPAKYAGWYIVSQEPYRWEQILVMLGSEGYDLSVLPYYEYTGSSANGGIGLGKLKRSETLSGNEDYTHVSWSEKMNIDVSDPDAVTDSEMLLEVTIKDLANGNRPVPKEYAGSGMATWSNGRWGYIDFGPDWEDVRITEGWTRSVIWHEGDPSPYQAVYWHTDTSGFSGDTVPQGAIAETTINFITQDQSGVSNYWTKDFGLSQANAITPQARYLNLRAADSLTSCAEFALIGWVEDGGDPDIQTLVPYGVGGSHPIQYLFDNQPEYNTAGVEIAGAWWRTRPSAIPNGFSDTTLERFRQDISYGSTITRSTIESQGLLEDYYDWWNLERRDYVLALRDYLQTNVNSDAVVLYSWDHTESGTSPAASIICDYLPRWQYISGNPKTCDEAVTNELHLTAMQTPVPTWGGYEWHHSIPRGDPWNYSNDDDVMMEYVFNKLYTVPEPDWLDEYRSNSGLAVTRHYCLNEDCMTDSQDSSILGYFVCDFEVAGPYCVLPDARAVAYGNPTYIGYLSSNNFNRGFPAYVREFNANFLALPALPMADEAGATTEDDVVVRSITTANDGTWLAIINVGLEDLEDVEITLPVSGTVTDAVTGSAITVSYGKITLDLWPGRLKSIHIDN